MPTVSDGGHLQVKIYSPNGIELPRELGVEREIAVDKNAPPRMKDLPADKYTVLFDVFRSQSNRLMAIGPAWRNLAGILKKLRIFLDGVELSYKRTTKRAYRRNETSVLEQLEIEVPRAVLEEGSELELQFRWPQFNRRLCISPRTQNTGRKHDLTLVTLQKNTPPDCISDWIKYHVRAHGVSRVLIYDNGSSNFSGLLSKLEALTKLAEIHVIKWAYPYGPLGSAFAQRGALQHCYHAYGASSRYYLSFDVDEYVVNSTQLSLAQYLDANMSANVPALVLSELRIPSVFDKNEALPAPERRRVSDFRYRERKHKPIRTHSGKLIFKPQGLECVSVHSAAPHWPRWAYPFMRSWKLREWTRKHTPKLPAFNFEKVAQPKDLYFNHYIGVADEWKGASKSVPQAYDESKHIPEEAVSGLFRKYRPDED